MIQFFKNINGKKYQFEKGTILLIMLLIFVFGGIFGFLYEEIFYKIDLGYFVKRGTTFGPWIPIYGFGAVFIVLTTERVRSKAALVFLISMVVCGILEFATGYVLWHVLGVRLWDYNVEIWNWLNIGGYICLRSVVFFGFSALFMQYIIHPIFKMLADRMSRKAFAILAILPAALFAIDIVVSETLKIMRLG